MSNLPKLVRDNVPEILASSGLRHDIEVLSNEQYIKALEDKLLEELNEYYESRKSEHADGIEELVDLYEVTLALVNALGCNMYDFDNRVIKKRNDRGSFRSRFLLKKIYEEETENE